MLAALKSFEMNMGRVRSLHALRESFSSRVTPVVDLSDMLRAEVVLAVSALDHFVHELTRLGMLESWKGNRKKTDAFGRFHLSLSAAALLTNTPSAMTVLETEIRNRHSFLSFQHPEKISDAVRLFSDVKLWEAVGNRLGEDASAIKSSLVLIVDRRNKIAHEADVDPSYPGQRWPINVSLVEGIFSRIESISTAIYSVAV
ncbi:MAG: hypothetical protein V4527_12180 [Pseudomonadota bacterium]